jgi:hypothetical protein
MAELTNQTRDQSGFWEISLGYHPGQLTMYASLPIPVSIFIGVARIFVPHQEHSLVLVFQYRIAAGSMSAFFQHAPCHNPELQKTFFSYQKLLITGVINCSFGTEKKGLETNL